MRYIITMKEKREAIVFSNLITNLKSHWSSYESSDEFLLFKYSLAVNQCSIAADSVMGIDSSILYQNPAGAFNASVSWLVRVCREIESELSKNPALKIDTLDFNQVFEIA